jgi:hypothetical protein
MLSNKYGCLIIKNTFKFRVSKFSTKPRTIDIGDSSKDTNSLNEVLNSQIKIMEDSYIPIDRNEEQNFLNSNSWVLFEKENSSNIALKKSQGEFDVNVRFSSKEPEMLGEQSDPSGI